MPPLARTAAEAIAGRWTIGPSGCWIWTGKPKPGNGYGQVKIGGRAGLVRYAHVVVYEVMVGPVPEGTELDHRCRRLLCVRPDHLEPVTHRRNVLRGVSPSAINARRTECKHGHPFDEANTYVRPDGKGRNCRTCRNRRDADRRR